MTSERFKWDGRRHLDWPGARYEAGGSWEEEEEDRIGAWLRTQAERSKSGPISQPSLAKTFAKFPILPSVRFLEMRIGEACAEYLSAWTRILPNVKHLTLMSTPRLDSAGMTRTKRDCEAWKCLRSLDIDIVTDDLYDFALTLIRANRALRSLIIGAINLKGSVDRIGTAEKGLTKAIGDLQDLRELTTPNRLRTLTTAHEAS